MIGIYYINLGIDGKYYIGQSTNIPERITNHRSMLKNNRHYNYKLQQDFNTLKSFDFGVILTCKESELDYFEDCYIKEFNSIEEGYNIADSGKAGRGINHGSSVYSKEQIIDVFFYGLDLANTYRNISEATGVSISTVRHILGRTVHYWLDEEFPEESKILREMSSTRIRNTMARQAICKTNYKFNKLMSPAGVVYEVSNISAFGREHSLDSNKVGEVLRGTRNMHKGWIGFHENNISRLE